LQVLTTSDPHKVDTISVSQNLCDTPPPFSNFPVSGRVISFLYNTWQKTSLKRNKNDQLKTNRQMNTICSTFFVLPQPSPYTMVKEQI